MREAVGRFRTANPRIFGAVLHGANRDGSDFDLLDELESLLGIHVDLLTPGDLPPKFRAKVLAKAQPV